MKARAILSDFADEGHRQPYSGITDFENKAAEMAARIAGVMTLWSNLTAKEVGSGAMRDAVSLAAYYLDEATRLMRDSCVGMHFRYDP